MTCCRSPTGHSGASAADSHRTSLFSPQGSPRAGHQTTHWLMQFGSSVTGRRWGCLPFLGFGVQPPQPAWGNMLAEGKDFLYNAWWLLRQAAPRGKETARNQDVDCSRLGSDRVETLDRRPEDLPLDRLLPLQEEVHRRVERVDPPLASPPTP